MTLRHIIRGFDSLLCRYYGIHQFTDDPDCIVRIALVRAGHDVMLADGTFIRSDDPVIDLHWWNERLPRIPEQGPDAAWAAAMRRGVLHSLRALARHMAVDSQLDAVRALRADIVVGSRAGRAQVVRVARRFGFVLVERPTPHGLAGQLRLAGDSLLVWGLIWAY